MKLYEFAEKVYSLEGRGKRVSRLFIGESEEPTPKRIIEAGVKSLRAGRTKYSSAQGERKLRERIAEIDGVKPGKILVTPGSKLAVFTALKILCPPGSNMVTPTPHWPGYEAICNSLGIELKTVETSLENDWVPSAKSVSDAIDSRTRVLVLCNPCNPTSTIIPKKELKEIIEKAHAKKIHVLLDEAYKGLSFKDLGEQADLSNPLNLSARSFSKGYSMTGWRLGYLVASEEIVRKGVSLMQSTVSCVPQFVQDAGLEALEKPEEQRKFAKTYEERARVACEVLSGEFEFATPQAGFYIFVGKKNLDGDALCLRLLEKGIGIAPGSAFGKNNFVRISLTQEKEKLGKSLGKVVREARKMR
jgi:aspartate aminotransferase